MRKILIIFSLFILCGCASNNVEEVKEPLYKLTIDNKDIIVGETSFDDGEELLKSCSEFHTSLINDALTINSITLYLDDIDGDVKIDDDTLNRTLGIENTCYLYNGEYIEKNGHVCIISKEVDGYINTISIYSDILNDDIDKIDHIIIDYKLNTNIGTEE